MCLDDRMPIYTDGMTLKSVDHALLILEILQDHQDAGVTELAQKLRISPSSAHRVLTTLVDRGFARRSAATKRYRLGPAFDGVRRPDANSDYVGIAHDILVELERVTGETVHLAALDGGNCSYLDAVVSRQAVHVPNRIGTPIPAYAASAGKVLLSSVSQNALMNLYPAENLTVITPSTIVTRSRLKQELASVRFSGYARVIEEWERGTSAVAMGVPTGSGFTFVALTISGPQERLRLTSSERRTRSEQILVRHLRDATEALRRRVAA